MLVDRSARIWAMRPDEMVGAQALALRAARADGLPLALGRGEILDGSDFARVVDGVAVIPVYGTLMRSMNWWAWSYEEVARDRALALGNPAVRGIIYDVDSGGGIGAGCGDLAAQLRDDGGKPTQVFVGGMAASAAYWLASAAGPITLGSGAILGSIGVVIEYVDMEPYFQKLGARIVRVVAEQSPNKRLDPDSTEGQAEMQDLCNAMAAEFVTAVALARDVPEATVMAEFGQGLVFDGGEAIRRGMADRRGTLDEMIAEMAGRRIYGNAAPAAAAQENPMDWASLTLAALREHRADLVTAVEQAASTAAAATQTAALAAAELAGASAERTRLLGLDELAMAGHEALVAAAKADGKTTPEQLALQIVKAERSAGANHLAGRAAADTGVAVPPVAALPQQSAAGAANAPLETRAKAAWDASADLQAEFGGKFDAYLAFEKANASGQARILAKAP